MGVGVGGGGHETVSLVFREANVVKLIKQHDYAADITYMMSLENEHSKCEN